jgi:tetratricopeptide (TPR) repeat protein
LSTVVALALFGCATALPPAASPIDQVPMYGGMDRSAYPDLRAADETFIRGVTKEFGSREAASRNFVNYAFELYRKDDLARAMRRFNQAWLLNPNNAEVYWGFASVIHDRGDFCQSIMMMEKAIELGISPDRGFLADAGLVASRCALTSETLSPTEQKRYLEKSEQLFQRSEQEDSNRAYVYGTWARAYRDQKKYSEAWQMVGKQRSAGGNPDERFLSLLRSEFPELGQR